MQDTNDDENEAFYLHDNAPLLEVRQQPTGMWIINFRVRGKG